MATNWKKLRSASRLTRFADPRFTAFREANPKRLARGKRGRKGRRAPAAKQEWFRVLIQLGDGLTAANFAQGIWGTLAHPRRSAPKGWRDWIRVPPVYRNLPESLQNITFCTALVGVEFFQNLRSDQSLRQIIGRIQIGLPAILGRDEAPRPVKISKGIDPPGMVVMGIIDDGIAFAHERFRNADGTTRIEYFWDQDPRWGSNGRELTKDTAAGIDALMANANYAGTIDEDEVYAVSGHLDYAHLEHKAVAWRISHGTHVMDLACGFDPAVPPVTPRPIVCVQLPARATADTSGRQLDPWVYEALIYILRRADDVATKYGTGPLPVVVNLSYSVIAPDKHTEILVPAVDELISTYNALKIPLAVTLPAGNEFLSRCHARVRLAIGQTMNRPLTWQVQPGDATNSWFVIWLPRVTGSTGAYPYQVQVRIRTPTGDLSPWISEGDYWTWEPGGAVIGVAVYENSVGALERNRIRVALRPTESVDGTTPVAPSGAYEVRIRNVGGVPVRMTAWIQRDDTPYGYPRRGRQSRFEDPNYLRFNPITGREEERELHPASYVKRFGTINRLATGSQTIVLGGFRRSDRVPAKYSAAGPVVRPVGVLSPYRDGPDAMAPSEDSPACHGQLGAGSRSGGAVAMAGTSVTAPRIARWIADQMAIVGAPHDRTAVAQLAQTPPNGVPITVPSPPPTPLAQLWRAGAGGIDIDAPGAPTVVPQVRPRMGIQRRER